MQSDLENFLAITEHRRPERILYYASMTPDLLDRVIRHIGTKDVEGHYGMMQADYIPIPLSKTPTPPDYFSLYWKDEKLPEGTRINDLGVAEVPSGFYHFTGYVSPLRNATSIKEIENYPLETINDLIDLPALAKAVNATRQKGRIPRGSVGDMYETAWQIRGYEEFLADMIERPAWAECLLDRIAEQNLLRAKAYAAVGCTWIQCGDDVANQKTLMFSPPMWRDMMLSRWKKIWQTIKQINPQVKIWYHSDGNIFDIAGELIEAGVDILNPLQPECLDLEEIYRRYGRRVTFDGCIGTQSTMPWGSPADVSNRVREVIDRYGQNGGLIISPTHILEPEVPIANIDAFFDACREYGTFE